MLHPGPLSLRPSYCHFPAAYHLLLVTFGEMQFGGRCSIRIDHFCREIILPEQIGYKIKVFQMRLLLNYKGINKILPKVQDYNSIVKFVNENFFLKMSRWTLSYIDSDGDAIALDSDLDVQTMLDTITKDHLKVYIKDADVVQENNISADILPAEEPKHEEPKQEEPREQPKEEPKQEFSKAEVMEEAPVRIEERQEKMEEPVQPEENSHMKWKEHWKKKMEEKMAKFVDERIQSLLPCLVKQIEDKINKVESKIVEKAGVTHEVACIGCGVSPICGIRYKCTKCPSFNFCESCENTISHEHNMIKMKFLEEPEKVEENKWGGRCGWQWRRRHHGQDENPYREGAFKNLSGSEERPSKPVCGFWIPNQNVESECRKEKEEDPTLKLTRKCFRMSKFFGEKPEAYREFVQKNVDLKFHELTQLYVAENGENVGMSDATSEKIEERLEKVSFYFNEPKDNFVSAVKKNPTSNLKELIRIVKEERQPKEEKIEEPVAEEKKEEDIPPEEKAEEAVPEEKKEEVAEKVEEGIVEIPEIKVESEIPPAPVNVPKPAPPQEQPRSFWGLFKKPVDARKKNECIIQMKDLFGPENVYEYIKFFDENSELSQEQIIASYIEKLSKE